MEILGLIVSVFIYASALFLLVAYFVTAIMKKYELANLLFSYTFLHCFFTGIILVWAFIVMNKNIHIDYNQGYDYTITLAFIIPLLIGIALVDYKTRKAYEITYNQVSKRVYRYLLPVLVFVLFSIVTLMFYFNIRFYYDLTNSVW